MNVHPSAEMGLSIGQVQSLGGEPRARESVQERQPLDLARRERPLASLAAAPMFGRFCAWRGASDQRYVASVYTVDRRAGDAGLPDFEAFVLIFVARAGLGRCIVGVATIERSSDRRAALAAGLDCGADEWHVHFLAEDLAARAAMVADLRARHVEAAVEAGCA